MAQMPACFIHPPRPVQRLLQLGEGKNTQGMTPAWLRIQNSMVTSPSLRKPWFSALNLGTALSHE